MIAVVVIVGGASTACGGGKASSCYATTTTVPRVGTGGLSGCGARTALAVAYGVRRRSVAVGPPSGLGQPAAMFWNIDALVREGFGRAEVCVQHYNVLVRSSGYCAVDYAMLFPSARHSAFRLVKLTQPSRADQRVTCAVLPACRSICELRQRSLARADERAHSAVACRLCQAVGTCVLGPSRCLRRRLCNDLSHERR
jgi:hypothetical protein